MPNYAKYNSPGVYKFSGMRKPCGSTSMKAYRIISEVLQVVISRAHYVGGFVCINAPMMT